MQEDRRCWVRPFLCPNLSLSLHSQLLPHRYCFGAKYVVRHLLPDSAKIDVGYCAHPSFVEEAELRDMKGPLAIAAAETDAIFPEEKRHRTEEILKEMGAAYQINLYSGECCSGFAMYIPRICLVPFLLPVPCCGNTDRLLHALYSNLHCCWMVG